MTVFWSFPGSSSDVSKDVVSSSFSHTRSRSYHQCGQIAYADQQNYDDIEKGLYLETCERRRRTHTRNCGYIPINKLEPRSTGHRDRVENYKGSYRQHVLWDKVGDGQVKHWVRAVVEDLFIRVVAVVVSE